MGEEQKGCIGRVGDIGGVDNEFSLGAGNQRRGQGKDQADHARMSTPSQPLGYRTWPITNFRDHRANAALGGRRNRSLSA